MPYLTAFYCGLLNFIAGYCITPHFPVFFTAFPCNLILFNVLMIFYVLSVSTWHLVIVWGLVEFYDFSQSSRGWRVGHGRKSK